MQPSMSQVRSVGECNPGRKRLDTEVDSNVLQAFPCAVVLRWWLRNRIVGDDKAVVLIVVVIGIPELLQS